MRILSLISMAAALLPAAELSSNSTTPAERAIAVARQSSSSIDLARALVRRHRETEDPKFLADAETALQPVFKSDAESFDGSKVRVMIHLARGEYETAAALARTLNKRIPDDALVYGLMADAYMALGDYAEAEKQAQWMINLRRANLGGMTRGALLRELFGDIDGATEWLTSSYRLTSAGESEERAWLLTQAARMNFSIGKLDFAAKYLAQAQTQFPGHPLALRYQAELLLREKKTQEALDVIDRLPAQPRRVWLKALATGDFAAFTREAEARLAAPDNLNRELSIYYSDIANRPADALRVAQVEARRRQDIYTLDALAWALHKNGRSAEAKREIEKALKVGTKDAGILAHAAAITPSI
jgi:tetratricopeptide (TPR) repeat protein